MAEAQPTVREDYKYQRLSDFYLRLWKQLDLACGDANWLQITPVSQVELRKEAKAILQEIDRWLTVSVPLNDGAALHSDFDKAQYLVEQATQKVGDLYGFRDYLRDRALRYSRPAVAS
jgi:hypothetical protein